MMTHSVLTAGYGAGDLQNTSFCVQDHVAPPPRRSTLKSSSSEGLNTERLLHNLMADPSHCSHKKHLKFEELQANEHVLSINGCEDLSSSSNGRHDFVNTEREGSVDVSESESLSVSDFASIDKASLLQDLPDLRSRGQKRSGRKRSKSGRSSILQNHVEAQDVEEALVFLESLPNEPLPTDVFIPILKKCRKQKDLAHARRLHLHMCKHGFESHGVLKNFIVTIFVERRCMREAEQLVNRLANVDEHCWNTLIQGYIECGESTQAFRMYTKMQEQFVPFRRYILMALLKTFSLLKCLEKGQELHAKIVEEGLEKDRFFCNTLVDMYFKCDSLPDAQEVFYEHSFKDVVLWSTFISGFTEFGLFENVLRCWDQLVSEGLDPDILIFVCSLRACTNLGELDKGRQIHTAIIKQLLEKEAVVGNTLVDMYAKCGSLADSQEVFEKLPVQDVVSWTSFIAGYADHNLGEEALKHFGRMKDAGVMPNDVTFLCILKACGSIGAISKGQNTHAEIAAEEYESYPLVSSALVVMYSKFGLFSEARFLFNRLPDRNEITWTALMEAYAEHGLYKRALRCFLQMQLQGVFISEVTFLCILKACCSPAALEKGRDLHVEITKTGFERDLSISSTLVDMYLKCGSPVEAQFMFDRLPTKNVISWTALIGGYAKHGHTEVALQRFRQMTGEGVLPEAVTYVYSLKACSDLRVIEEGRSIHVEVVLRGVEKCGFVGPALVEMYAKTGSFAEAYAVFQTRDIFSWHVLIGGFAECGLCEEAFCALKQMQLEGVAPDGTAWVSCIKACQGSEFVDRCRELHSQIVKQGIDEDVSIGHAILDMYIFHGSFADARSVFDKLSDCDDSMWSDTITGLC